MDTKNIYVIYKNEMEMKVRFFFKYSTQWWRWIVIHTQRAIDFHRLDVNCFQLFLFKKKKMVDGENSASHKNSIVMTSFENNHHHLERRGCVHRRKWWWLFSLFNTIEIFPWIWQHQVESWNKQKNAGKFSSSYFF